LRLHLWTLQEPEIERREYQDNSNIRYQPLPEVMPEEQDVHADHDGYQREHVKHDGRLSSHRLVLLCATGWINSGTAFRLLARTAPGVADLGESCAEVAGERLGADETSRRCPVAVVQLVLHVAVLVPWRWVRPVQLQGATVVQSGLFQHPPRRSVDRHGRGDDLARSRYPSETTAVSPGGTSGVAVAGSLVLYRLAGFL
jgi:hypothetical protein